MKGDAARITGGGYAPAVSAGQPGLSGTAPSSSAGPSTSRYQAFTREVRVTLKLLRPSAYATNIMSGLFTWNMRGGKGKGQPNRDLFSQDNSPPYEAQTQAKAYLAPVLSRRQRAEAARQRKRERAAQVSGPGHEMPRAAKRRLWGCTAAKDKAAQMRKSDGKSHKVVEKLSDFSCRRVRRQRTGKTDMPAVLPGMPRLPGRRGTGRDMPVDVAEGAGDTLKSLPPHAGEDRETLPPHVEAPVRSRSQLHGVHREQWYEYRQLHTAIVLRFGARPADLAMVDDLHRDLLMLSSLEEGLQCGECEAIVNKLALASGYDLQLAHQILKELGTTYDIACNGAQAGTVSEATWHAALLLSRDPVGLGLLKRLAICRMQASAAATAQPGGQPKLPDQLVTLHETWRAFLCAREQLERAVIMAPKHVAAAKAAYDTAQAQWTKANLQWREQEYQRAPQCDAYRNFLEAADTLCSRKDLTMQTVLAALAEEPAEAAGQQVAPVPADAHDVAGKQEERPPLERRVMHAARQALQHYGTAANPGTLATRLGRQATLDYFMWNQGFRDDGPEGEFMRVMARIMKIDKYAERAVKRFNGEASELDPRQWIGMKKTPITAMGGDTFNFQSALAQADRSTYDKALLALGDYKVALIREEARSTTLAPEKLAEYAVQLAVVAIYKEQQALMAKDYAAGKDGTQRPLMSELDPQEVRRRVMGSEEGGPGTLQALLEAQVQTKSAPLSETMAGKQRVEEVVITITSEPDAETMQALDALLGKPIKLSRAQLEAWLPQVAGEARAVVRERAGKKGATREAKADDVTAEADAERREALAMVKHFTTLHWLERGGEFMSVATKAKIYDFMARAAEGMRNNTLTGTTGAEVGVDLSVVVPVAPAVNLRPRIAATGSRTATMTQSRNLNGLSVSVSSGRGGAGELGLESIFGADTGLAGVGAYLGASAGYEESRNKGATVRFKTDIVQDANGKHSFESATDPFLKDADGKPAKLDASRVGIRRFFEFMKQFGEGEITQATGHDRLQDFMAAFAAEFVETRCLELTGTRQSSRSVHVTTREQIGLRVGTDDARAFFGVGSDQQGKAQTKVLKETSRRAAANNSEAELYGVVRGTAGVSLTPGGAGTAQAKLPGVNVLSVQATPVESSINVQIKQQTKDGQLDEFCTFHITAVRSVEALRAVLGPDIDQWREYASGDATLQKFLDEYSLEKKGDNSMFFQCIKNLRKPAIMKIRNYDSQLDGLETELVMARKAGDRLRISQLEMQVAHIRSERNAVFHDDSNWKLYSLTARQYIDRGKGIGPRFGIVVQKKKTKAITEEIEWFSWSLDTRAKAGYKMEQRELLTARIAQMPVPAHRQNDAEAWRAERYEELCGLYGLSRPAAAPAA
ncbi:hypothetical protein MW7_001375 [Imbroritus primus]|uniref:Uncharacterized protein n=1 Tax=Imbroritus primus TaxID=3058603 RepID=A0ACD3SUK2_9BURK|nr:hypothetical protein MW7_001375 [Burkholderiaceae bacterium PBA]